MTLLTDTYRVAAVQFEPMLGAKSENIARLLALVETAAQNGARLIVLPEMATTGYCWYSRDEVRPYVEPIPGPTTEAFAQIADRYNCYIVIGMPEVAPHSNIFYNSAAFVGPNDFVQTYRKTHSFTSDRKWAKDGDIGLPVWETPLGRIGILICMDAGYFEPARLLALAGADVLCFPTNWLNNKSPSPAWSMRAYENGCYMIAANRYGLERGVQFSGGSAVINPDGTIQAMQDAGDGIVYGEISLTAARAKSFGANQASEKLAARQPQLYDNMTLNGYLGGPMELHELYDYRPLPAGRRSHIAVAQFTPVSGEPTANMAWIEHILTTTRGRSEAKIDLAVFPEYTLTGVPDGNTQIALGGDDLQIWLSRLATLCQRLALCLVVGYAERSRDQLYSSVALVGPDGVLARYRKTHVIGQERAWCTPGDMKPPVIDLPLGRVGLLVGSDLCFPEMARSLAIEGCDLIAAASGAGLPPVRAGEATAVPLHHPGVVGYDRYHFHLVRQRTYENNTYIAFASLPTPHGIGCSGVFGPDRDGEIVLDTSEPASTVRMIDTSHVTAPYPSIATVRAKELLQMRQTYLYEPLQTR